MTKCTSMGLLIQQLVFKIKAEADTLVEQEFQRCGAIQLPAQSQDTATRVIDILLHPAEYKAVETFVRTSLEGKLHGS